MATWTEWNLNDLIYGIILPIIAAFLIIIFPTAIADILLEVDPSFGLNAILVDGLGEALLVTAIPLFAGLIWNKWAGGATGFLLGSIYALYVNDVYATFAALGYVEMSAGMMVQEITNLGFVVSAMLVGFISGALNRGSYSFRRMVVAAMVAGVIASLFQLWVGTMSPINMATDIPYVGFTILLPKIIYGIVIPIFVTLFGWFGISPKQMM